MRRLGLSGGASCVALLSLLLGVAACSAGGDSDKLGGSGGSSSSGGSGNSGGIGVNQSSVCGTSQVGAPRLRRLNRDELSATLSDVFPEANGAWTASFSADPISHYGFDNDASLLVVGKQAAGEIDKAASAIGAAISAAPLATLLPCSAAAADQACASEFLQKYGKRLFRRPLSAEETTRYLALFTQVQTKTTFANGISFLTRALIQSPNTLYRREVGSATGNAYQLGQHEIATELAYTYSGTTPSDALLAQADAGQLTSPEALVSAAAALLATPNGAKVVHKFFQSWVGYRRVSTLTKTAPENFAQLRDEMAEETQRFIAEVVLARKGGLLELLTASYTTPSPSLAAFYGFPAPAAPYGVVERAPGRGIGILAQGSVLATRALPNSSSPTQRGLFVYERLLCRSRPTVPANVPQIPTPQLGTLTTRQRYELSHASVDPCKTCHKAFDPIGFGFEHFDGAGQYRADEGGLPIDSSGSVSGDSAPLFSFTSQEELANGLAQQNVTYECATGYMWTYAFGAGEQCLGETRRSEFIEQKLGFVDYLASLAGEPHFVRRELK